MGSNIPLGRFAGIKLSMSWMVPIVGLFYAVSLAENRLPIEVPGQSHSSYWIVGGAGAVLFFMSLLAHEVGHAVVARREGIGVEGISLWLLGGVAKLEHEAETAGAELRVAVVGPLTSAAVGVFFIFLNQILSGGTGMIELFASAFGWLAFINLLLAAFNLLPGAPLDGGRVLSALLWMRTRNQTSAQAAGARFGQVLGGGMLALGGYLLANHGNQNGFVVLGVGGFILFSATAELRSTAAFGLLRDIRLTEVMEPDPPILPDWMSVHDLVASATRYLPHTAFVTRGMDGQVSGLITAEAIQATDPNLWPQLRLRDLAFPISRLQVASVADSVMVTMQRSRNGVTGRVLVLEADGRIAGVIGSDITQRAAAIHQQRQAFEALPPIEVAAAPLPAGMPQSAPSTWAPRGPAEPAQPGPPTSWPANRP